MNMNSIYRILAVLAVAGMIVSMVQPGVEADGIPLTKVELHGTLRENRQLAYISVDADGSSERLDLFLNVVSLEPGNNITIMIPLRTRPYSVYGEEMSEYRFRQERNFNGIERLAEMQNHALGELADRSAGAASELAMCQAMGFLRIMVIGMGAGSTEDDRYEITDGVSMGLLSFNSTDSLSGFYASQGLEVPAEVRDIIDRYGDFNVGLINAVTRPPIDEARFDLIARHCPSQLHAFRTFVAANPTITAYEYGYYDFGWDNAELRGIMSSIGDEQTRWYFNELIAATYGQSQVNGTLVSFRLPLREGIAFFPLGTTPAWNGVQETEVIFRIDDSKTIGFGRNGEGVFTGGYHYYVWDFGATFPDYDLEGKVKAAGFTTGLARFGRHSEQWLYEKSESLGMILAALFFVGLWSAGFCMVSRLRKWEKGGKRRMLLFLVMGTSCFTVSMFLTVLVGVMFAMAGLVSMDNWYGPDRSGRSCGLSPKSVLKATLFILLTITGLICILGLSLTGSRMACSIPLAISLMGVFFISLHIILAAHPSAERRMMAWLLYLATMGPSFIFVSAQAFAFCTVAFAIFMIIQTAIYVSMVRLEEDEPARKPERWWGDEI